MIRIGRELTSFVPVAESAAAIPRAVLQWIASRHLPIRSEAQRCGWSGRQACENACMVCPHARAGQDTEE
eukprot:15476414-Alexandrium_andersonii.AAC.1